MTKMRDSDLLAWQASYVKRAQDDRIHGRVVTHIEGGRITRVETQESHKPPQPKDIREG